MSVDHGCRCVIFHYLPIRACLSPNADSEIDALITSCLTGSIIDMCESSARSCQVLHVMYCKPEPNPLNLIGMEKLVVIVHGKRFG